MNNIISIIEKIATLLSEVFSAIKEKLKINEVNNQRQTNQIEDAATDKKIKEKKVDDLNKELGYDASTPPKKRGRKKASVDQKSPKKITAKKTTKKK